MRGKDEMTQDGVIEKIFNMGQVSAILHTVSPWSSSLVRVLHFCSKVLVTSYLSQLS